jgi:hypothetical protein
MAAWSGEEEGEIESIQPTNKGVNDKEHILLESPPARQSASSVFLCLRAFLLHVQPHRTNKKGAAGD